MTIGIVPKENTAHTLIGTLAWLKADPEGRRVRVRGIWPELDYDLAGFQAWFSSCLDRRISFGNRLENEKPRGRKDCLDWWSEARRIADKVNHPRLIVRARECPPEFRARLAHRLTRPEEE